MVLWVDVGRSSKLLGLFFPFVLEHHEKNETFFLVASQTDGGNKETGIPELMVGHQRLNLGPCAFQAGALPPSHTPNPSLRDSRQRLYH